jgi:DNA-binding SARP family transcriptional activator
VAILDPAARTVVFVDPQSDAAGRMLTGTAGQFKHLGADLSWLVERLGWHEPPQQREDDGPDPAGRSDAESHIVREPSVTEPSVSVRCLGQFAVTVDGRPIDVRRVKPRARAVLQMLALQAGQLVHRDQLMGALWPDDGLESGVRNLHVAISSLRRLVEPAAGRGEAALIVREGDGYRLAVDPGAHDVALFEHHARAGRRASENGDHAGAAGHLRRALAAYEGDLVPEAGAAEWVLEPRERYRLLAAASAHTLAECLLVLDEAAEAVSACERGLEIDRYRDGLWRTLMASFARAGDHLAAARARHRYEQVLSELEVPVATSAS